MSPPDDHNVFPDTEADFRYPYLKFFPGDWLADTVLRMASIPARALAIDLIALMHRAKPYGHLMIGGIAPTPAELAGALAGWTPETLAPALAELERRDVFSRNPDGVLYSRRMVRDRQKAILDAENGAMGGRKSANLRGKKKRVKKAKTTQGHDLNGGSTPLSTSYSRVQNSRVQNLNSDQFSFSNAARVHAEPEKKEPGLSDVGPKPEPKIDRVVVSAPMVASSTATAPPSPAETIVHLQDGTAIGRAQRFTVTSDWQPGAALRSTVKAKLGMSDDDIDAQVSKFRNYHLAKGSISQGANSFVGWCRKARQFRSSPAPKSSNGGFTSSRVDTRAWTDDEWRRHLKFYAEMKHWPRGIGPEPLSPACRAPRSLFAESGLDPTTGERRRPIRFDMEAIRRAREIGKRTLISVDDAEEWLQHLPLVGAAS
jgi:hypothetical protein